MSKVFAFSTSARRRVSQCCAARLISGSGCSGNEGRPKAPTRKRNKGNAGWRKKMGSRYGEVPSPLQAVTSTNEASLLATAKSGETAALDTLYRAHAEKLFRTVHRITRNREDAEDAVQDSLLRAFLHLKSFDGRSTFSTWLTRIGINSALIILRKKRSSREIFPYGPCVNETLWEVPDSTPNPEIRWAEREQEGILRDAISNLRPKIRRALELQILEHRSIEETAAEIGISVSAAKGRVFHAKAALRKSEVLRKINQPNWHGLEVKRGE